MGDPDAEARFFEEMEKFNVENIKDPPKAKEPPNFAQLKREGDFLNVHHNKITEIQKQHSKAAKLLKVNEILNLNQQVMYY